MPQHNDTENSAISTSKLLGNLGNMMRYAVVASDIYEMALFALSFKTGAIGAFLAIDGQTQYFDCVVGSYKLKRHSIKSGKHVWAYLVPKPGSMVQSNDVWLYKTFAGGWLFGIDSKERPSEQLIEGINAVALGAIGFVLENEKRTDGKDKLTGLLDRTSLFRDLKHMVKIAENNGTAIALMLFDVNNFKKINDTLGHNVGDRCLCSQAHKLQRALGVANAYRLSGDEFCGIVTGQDVEQISEIAHRIEAASEESPGGIKISISAGISMYKYGEDTDTFIERADQAMFESKRLFKARMLAEGQPVSR